ncbi:MAG: EAL domain-containing protein [Methylophilaceae bacterium]|nr:MAG: EAL domain-containing protein [Methylophilaceae bacterium]
MVLEILEDTPINAQIITRCKALKEVGFKLAIVNYSNRPEHMVLLPYTDYVKMNCSHIDVDALSALSARIRKKSSAKIVAEKVEDEAMFLTCKQLGLDAFQGYFFAKPTILKGSQP